MRPASGRGRKATLLETAAYRALLLTLPPTFRAEAEEELLDVFRGHLERRPGVRHRLLAWYVAVRDVGETALAEWRRAWVLRHRSNVIGEKRTTMERVEAMIDDVRQDLRFAARALTRQPGMVLAATLTLALGIGGSTAIFSVVKGVFVDTLGYPDGDRIVYITETTLDGVGGRTSYENFRDWQSEASAFEAITVWINNSTNLTGTERPERIRGMFVTASYFDVAGVQPAMGRAIAPGEDEPGGPRTAVLAHGFWGERYGSDPDVLGRTIVLNNVAHEIVGVMPAGFRPVWGHTDAWISLPTLTGWALDRESKNLPVMARLKPGVSVARAQEALDALQAGLREAYPDANRDRGVMVRQLAPLIQAGVRSTLLILLAAAGMVLLIGCANVANLQLTRTLDRRREVGIRAALGGGRRRIAAQILTENLLLAGLGGAAGLGLAYLGVDLLLALEPGFGRSFDVDIDAVVLAVGMAIALATGIVFGSLPALRASRVDLSSALREGDRGRVGSARAARLRSSLVVAQTALAVVLLVGSGLLIRSVAAVRGVDPGFDADALLTLEFRLPPNKYDTPEKTAAFFDAVLAEANAIPGASVASSGSLPFSFNGGMERVWRTDQDASTEEGLVVQTNSVSPNYLELMGVPLLSGRGIEDTDRPGTARIAVASEDLTERLWPGEDPIGRAVVFNRRGEDIEVTIVGIAGAVRVSLTQEPLPHLYLPYMQVPTLLASLAVRAGPDPMRLASAVRDAVWTVDPDQPVWEIMLISDRIETTLGSRRFLTVLLSVFGAIALVLGFVGIYGVTGHSVSRRAREIGVRMALGAQANEIRAMVLRQGLGVTLVGVVLGVAGAAALSKVLAASLFQVSAHDPVTFVLVPIGLGIVATIACLVPARRATKVDPVRALEED